MRAAVLLALTACLSLPMPAAATPNLEPGVSLELAKWRAKRYRDVRYGLKLRLAEGADRVSGSLELSVTLPRATDLVLDWRPAKAARVWNVRANGAAAEPRLENEHLVIGQRALRAGKNLIELEFESPVAVSGAAITRYKDREDGAEYLYTLFVPSDASSAFPCFDQPDLKARFALELELPATWRAVSNAAAAGETAGRVRFAETEPIPTYLFAFAAGPFEAIIASGDATRLLVRRSRLERAREHGAEVLRINREAMQFFERYFARRFPFSKYDLVLVPEFPYGGMEHAGATFLNEERVVFPAAPSAADLLRRAQLIYHETSHQWFGDLVTMRWFDDLWLKEGFANFMATKATEALAPEFDAWTAFHALKTGGVRTDSTRGTSAIRYPLQNLSAAKSAYGAIVYAKGPAVLRQAEFYLGERAFREAVREFLRRHAYGAADWQDLVRAFERASGKRLSRWADAWVQRRGAPSVRTYWEIDSRGRLAAVRVEQRDGLLEDGRWPMRLRVVALGAGGTARSADVQLDRGSAAVPKLNGLQAPALVFANAGDYGYGRFFLDPQSRETALDPGFRAPDTLLQAQLAEALWEAVREAELAPQRYLEYALRELPRTQDDIALSALLARIEVAFRRYLTDSQRDTAASAIERALLAEGALAAATQSKRVFYLRAFFSIAWTRDALGELKRLLDGALQVPGVQLASRDRFRMIERLLTRDDPEAASRLAAQAAADRGDDGRRYAYGAGAAAADVAVKRALLRAFREDASLPESWIEQALAPFNAPEHAALTRPLLGEALALLPELKRTRKIFFVNNWLAAFVGGQTDAEALAVIETLLASQRLEPDLRLKLLEAADGLERSVRIRARFAHG
jgi:aminopeptidase N